MCFENFTAIPFPLPPCGGVVYVFFFRRPGVEKETIFYVGQTHRFLGRMEDYRRAAFAASTDFKVGETIRYLREYRKCTITVKYMQGENPEQHEIAIIHRLRQPPNAIPLLNDLNGYNYQEADVDEERHRIKMFCDEILIHAAG